MGLISSGTKSLVKLVCLSSNKSMHRHSQFWTTSTKKSLAHVLQDRLRHCKNNQRKKAISLIASSKRVQTALDYNKMSLTIRISLSETLMSKRRSTAIIQTNKHVAILHNSLPKSLHPKPGLKIQAQLLAKETNSTDNLKWDVGKKITK